MNKQHAEARFNGDLLYVVTYSGCGMVGRDPQGATHFLPVDATDETVGVATLDALSHSRQLTPEEAVTFFEYKRLAQRYAEWVADLMQRYGYKTRRALFREMRSCSIECNDGVITIRPSHHEKLEAWSGTGVRKEDYVTVGADRPPQEIGAALRVALGRCT